MGTSLLGPDSFSWLWLILHTNGHAFHRGVMTWLCISFRAILLSGVRDVIELSWFTWPDNTYLWRSEYAYLSIHFLTLTLSHREEAGVLNKASQRNLYSRTYIPAHHSRSKVLGDGKGKADFTLPFPFLVLLDFIFKTILVGN